MSRWRKGSGAPSFSVSNEWASRHGCCCLDYPGQVAFVTNAQLVNYRCTLRMHKYEVYGNREPLNQSFREIFKLFSKLRPAVPRE
jgi:hypothetical protein